MAGPKKRKPAAKTSTKQSTGRPKSNLSPRQMQDAIEYLERHPKVDHKTIGYVNAVALSNMNSQQADHLIETARRFGYQP